MEETRRALDADRVVVYEFDSEWKGTFIAESVGSNWPRTLNSQIFDPCFADRYIQPYQQGRVQATENIYEAGLTECHIEQLEPFEVKANLVAPIVVDKELQGLLIAHQCSGPRAWTELEMDLMRNCLLYTSDAADD